MNLSEVKRAHFVGIGGVGMSAIAKVMLERGVAVSGSDLKRSGAFTTLEAMGATVTVGHDPANVEGADLVIVSSAIPSRNPELVRAREEGLKVIARGEALAMVLSGSDAIVVAGTHGKTSTTSMIVSILRNAGLDPTYLVGGGLNDAGTNARYGRGRFSAAESDESDGSFLLLTPHIAVVTNIEVDHVDYWASLDALRAAFGEFLQRVDEAGVIVAPDDDADLLDLARSTGRKVVLFGPDGDVRAESTRPTESGMSFELHVAGELHAVEIRAPGEHNVSNALAAAAATHAAGVAGGEIAAGLVAFRGVERRFEVRGSSGGVTIVDDYAHHPTEVRATLEAARTRGFKRVFAVFQPHRYSRTAAFGREFGTAFGAADVVVVTDVYGAGESPVPGVSGKLIADAVCENLPGRPVAYLPHRDELVAYLERTTRPGDVLLTLGAGDVTSLGEELLERLERA